MGGARTRRPGPRLALEPWPGRPGRWMCRPSADLGRRYSEAVAEVAPVVEAALGSEVHAARVVRARPLRLEPWREARDRMAVAAAQMRRGASAVLMLDVERCFDRMRHDIVLCELARLGCTSREVEHVGSVLAEFAAAGVPGLPIGPEPSSVLANATLARLDEALHRTGSTHVRWMDDVALFAADADGIEAALMAARAALRVLGLTVRPDKLRVIRIGSGAPRRGVARLPAEPFTWLASLAADADARSCLGGPRCGSDARRLDRRGGRVHRGCRIG